MTLATSSEEPWRCIDVGSSNGGSSVNPIFSHALSIWGVLMAPGATQLTRMFRCPTSWAAARVNPSTPCLEASYAAVSVNPGSFVQCLVDYSRHYNSTHLDGCGWSPY